MIYFHPWELDIYHPKVGKASKEKFIHYYNLKSTRRKLQFLIRDFKLGTVREVLFK
jgi:hypothetical protein